MVEIFLIYDGISNSVFQSQVLAPVKKRAELNLQNKYIIVSFERQILPLDSIAFDKVDIIQLKKTCFVGMISLYLSLIKFKKFLRKYKNQEVNIIARGPFAGWLALKSGFNFKSIVIQARGLLCQEYIFQASRCVRQSRRQRLEVPGVSSETTGVSRDNILVKFRAWQFYCLERKVYSGLLFRGNVCVEAVTRNLQNYLCEIYGMGADKFRIAKDDIPEIISESLKVEYRNLVRGELCVPEHCKLYCYSGSAKAWQCPDKVLDYFDNIYKTDNNARFLILTCDIEFFTNAVKNKAFNANLHVFNVSAEHLVKYLAACDYGVIFRDDHIINRVARPTKVLEYRAARLEVVSNILSGFDY